MLNFNFGEVITHLNDISYDMGEFNKFQENSIVCIGDLSMALYAIHNNTKFSPRSFEGDVELSEYEEILNCIMVKLLPQLAKVMQELQKLKSDDSAELESIAQEFVGTIKKIFSAGTLEAINFDAKSTVDRNSFHKEASTDPCGNLPHPNVGQNQQNLAKAAHYIPIADSADERDALIAENMAKRLQGKENVNALDGSFQESKPVDAEEVPKAQEELVKKPSIVQKITGSIGLFKQAKEAPKPLEKKVLIYKAPSGELAIKFNNKEAFYSFKDSIENVNMPRNFVNTSSPQFKDNPNGIIPMEYPGEGNTLFFPSYTAGNGEFAINVVSSQLQGTLVKNILGGTHKKSASSATNSSDIKDLFWTYDTKGQESAIYFNQNHPVFSENASIEIAFDSDDNALTDNMVIHNGNKSSPAISKLR